MSQTQNVTVQGSIDIVFAMVFSLLLCAIAYVVFMVGFSEVHRYVGVCGAASIVSIAAYGLSNHITPISAFESKVYVLCTNVVLAAMLYAVQGFSTLLTITALAYTGTLTSIVIAIMRMLRR